MSNSYYLALWKQAQNDLGKNLAQDRLLKKKGEIKTKSEAKWLIGHLYMGYVRVVNKLEECYDQIVHPQKRELIKRLLDCSLGRLLEIKRDIVSIELDDNIFLDDVLMELKLTPDDIQIRVPQYFWRDREKSREERKILIKKVHEEMKEQKFKDDYLKVFPPERREEEWEKYLRRKETEKLEKDKLDQLQRKRMGTTVQQEVKQNEGIKTDEEKIADAVLLIQRHERARQTRRLLPLHKRRKALKAYKEEEIAVKVSIETEIRAAVVIQRHWRRHRRRILQERKSEKEMTLLGMLQPSWRDLSSINKMQEVIRYKREVQNRNQEEYENVLETVKEKIRKLYSMRMEEDITDEIRYWFEWFFLNSGCLPDYPDEELVVPTGQILGIPKKIKKEFIEKNFPVPKKFAQVIPKSPLAMKLLGIQPIGGSALVTAGHWIGPKEYLLCQDELEKMKKSGGGKEEKGSSKTDKAESNKKGNADKKQGAEGGFRISDSEFREPLAKADKDYRDYWLDLDETQTYEQRYIYDLVKDEKCWEVSMEVRRIVDEAMRFELEILQIALQRDKNPKKKIKQKKPKKMPRGKKIKDPTQNRTVDDLFMELFRNGIIREYDEAYLKDYAGERSYSAFEARSELKDVLPNMGDVRDLILQLCILPLGSKTIHQLSPVIRSVCLVGPEHSGKEFLTRIVCTETASILFDLTPENTAGKYEGPSNLKMLLHLVEKMSRILQPSVILIDGAEKLFYKKVPKEEKQYEPKRLGKTLTKIVKGIKQEDQVLVLGISSFPWLCPRTKLDKTYDKFIYVPEPDYGTYYMLWQKLLTPYHSLPKDFDFSCLARVSKGISLKTIMDVVQKVLTPKRIAMSRVDPYKPEDFLNELCLVKPMEPKIVEKCIGFYNNTELRKKNLAQIQEMKLALEKEKKK